MIKDAKDNCRKYTHLIEMASSFVKVMGADEDVWIWILIKLYLITLIIYKSYVNVTAYDLFIKILGNRRNYIRNCH